jgi:hypothetical protein
MPLATIKHAFRTAYEEVAEFRFDYPLKLVPEAGPKTALHYYVYLDRKNPPARSVLRLDSNGVACVRQRQTSKLLYRPGFIAMYGLGSLHEFLQTGEDAKLKGFLDQVDWLERNAVIRSDGAVVWPHDFDLPDWPTPLKAPWLSANVQGLVISTLVRAWRITDRPALIELLQGSARIFSLDHKASGIRVSLGEYNFYTEMPGGPWPGVLDGFLTSLLGLYDLWAETGDPAVRILFDDGIRGLKTFIPAWDYEGKWSWYGHRAYLSPPAYHCLNRLLLDVLGRLAVEPSLCKIASQWNPARLSAVDRVHIYTTFVATKNLKRIKHRTYRKLFLRPQLSSSKREWLVLGAGRSAD